MKQTLPLFHGTIYNEKYLSSYNTEEAVILFHGYPSTESKNEYIAEHISNFLNKDVFLFHYEGLGNSLGLFSFPKSILESIAYYNWVAKHGYKKITILGHSWGGLIALNLVAEIQQHSLIDKVILLSPYNYFPEGLQLTKLIDYIYEDTKDIFKQPKSIMTNQVQEILLSYQPRSKIQNIKQFPNPIYILQATNDNEVSPESTAEFVQLLRSSKTIFKKINTDHSFTENRTDFLNELTKILEQK